MSILGTRALRTEDPLFLTRGGLYTDDVEDERLTGALHVTFVRSPLAHARIGAHLHRRGSRVSDRWR
jgi:aerobic carbon-monoxide dehydrogenase large subunit